MMFRTVKQNLGMLSAHLAGLLRRWKALFIGKGAFSPQSPVFESFFILPVSTHYSAAALFLKKSVFFMARVWGKTSDSPMGFGPLLPRITVPGSGCCYL